MTLQRKHLLSMAAGATLLAVLLVLSSLTVKHELPAKQQVVLQNVRLYVPAKAPPVAEPTRTTRSGGSKGEVQVKIPQRQVELGLMQLNTRAAAMVSAPEGYGGGNSLGKGIGLGDGIADSGMEQLFSFNQLDSMPMVMSAPPLIYPEQMRRRNILQFRVLFHIIVDEDGRTHPVRVLESPDAAMNTMFMDYASRVSFTPPVHDGKRVKAQYSWPVLFEFKGLKERR
jgi:TonB family protein